MADEIVSGAPSGGAPSGGGGGAPSAPAAPATPSTPVAPVAATPATPAAAAPSTPATPATPPARNPGESDDAYMERARTAMEAAKPSGDEVKTPEQKAAEEKAAAAKVAPVQTPEEKAAAETKAAEEKAAADAKAKADAEAAPAPPSKFAEDLTKNEKVMAALTEAGVADDLFEELRQAASGRELQEVVGDIDSAKFMRAQAEGFGKADFAASNLKRGDIQSTQQFVRDVLMPMSYILDADGNPEMIEIDDGRGGKVTVPKTDGTVGVMLDNFRDMAWEQKSHEANQAVAWAKGNPDDQRSPALLERAENTLAALNILKEGLDKVDEGEVSEATKAERARLDADRKKLNEEKTADATKRFEAFRSDAQTQADGVVNGMIEEWIAGSSLADGAADSEQTKQSKGFLRTSLKQQIRDGVFAKLNADTLFMSEQEQNGRKGQNGLKALLNTYKRYTDRYIYKVADPLLRAAGHERVRQSSARSKTVAAQEAQSRTEARAGAQPSIPSVPKFDEVQAMRDSVKELRTELRREPTDDEKVERWNKKRAAGAVAKTA